MDNYEFGELLKLLDRIATSLEKLTSDNNESTPCQQHRYRVSPESGDIKCVDCDKLLRGS